MTRSLILASGSASRQRMLTAAGVAFIADPAEIDETAPPGIAPAALAARLADAKALAVSARHPGRLVLGSDSVLDFEGQPIGKSPDVAAARALLLRLSGKAHTIISSAALARDGRVAWRQTGTGRLTMRALSPAFLDAYLAEESSAILSSVGCYHLEGRGAQLFANIEGDFFSILGLPLIEVLAALREQGMLRT